MEGDLSCTTIGSSGCAACKRNLITFVDKLESLELQNRLVFKIASFADPDDAVDYVGIYWVRQNLIRVLGFTMKNTGTAVGMVPCSELSSNPYVGYTQSPVLGLYCPTMSCVCASSRIGHPARFWLHKERISVIIKESTHPKRDDGESLQFLSIDFFIFVVSVTYVPMIADIFIESLVNIHRVGGVEESNWFCSRWCRSESNRPADGSIK